jgi:hypothetical protein
MLVILLASGIIQRLESQIFFHSANGHSASIFRVPSVQIGCFGDYETPTNQPIEKRKKMDLSLVPLTSPFKPFLITNRMAGLTRIT